jgi:hypothetical protein
MDEYHAEVIRPSRRASSFTESVIREMTRLSMSIAMTTVQRAACHSAQLNREMAAPRTPLAAGHALEESAERPASGRLDRNTIPSVSIPDCGSLMRPILEILSGGSDPANPRMSCHR